MKLFHENIYLESYSAEKLIDLILNNKNLNTLEESKSIIIYPKAASSLPFVAKSKSSSNIYYELVFGFQNIEVNYHFKKQIIYSLIVELILLIVLGVLSINNPKFLVLALALSLVLIFSIVINTVSLYRAKKFLKEEILQTIIK